MLNFYECPACGNKGLKIDIADGFKIVTTGKPIREMQCAIMCSVCKRKIKYDVVKVQ